MLINPCKYIKILVGLTWVATLTHRHIYPLDVGVAITPSPVLHIAASAGEVSWDRCPCPLRWGSHVLPPLCQPAAGCWLVPVAHGRLPYMIWTVVRVPRGRCWQGQTPWGNSFFFTLSLCHKCPSSLMFLLRLTSSDMSVIPWWMFNPDDGHILLKTPQTVLCVLHTSLGYAHILCC